MDINSLSDGAAKGTMRAVRITEDHRVDLVAI